MELSVKIYKRKYDRELRHVKCILMQERRRMPVGEWLELVRKTRDSIINEPESYFGPGLPERTLFCKVIDKVFETFLRDQRLLANQTSRRFRIPANFK